MRILALSDQVDSRVYGPSLVANYPEVDLIVGCGDLPAYYLEYVVSVLNVPMVYVPGNHDPDNLVVPGGVSADGRLVEVNGLSIFGLGGSRRYKPKGKHQYTEGEMRWRVLRKTPKLLLHRTLRGKGVDILVTHAPPRGIHDLSDLAHTGFEAFLAFLRTFRPPLMLHGHVHVRRNLDVTVSEYHGCRIVNVFPARLVEFPDPREDSTPPGS